MHTLMSAIVAGAVPILGALLGWEIVTIISSQIVALHFLVLFDILEGDT